MEDYFVRIVIGKHVNRFIVSNHYSQRIPQIQYAIGLFSKQNKNELLGVITYGLPPGSSLNNKIPFNLLELNRVAMQGKSEKNLVSWFISQTYMFLPKPLLLISFADTGVGHIGYIYQATNWIYTGLSTIKKNYIISGRIIHNLVFNRLKNKPSNYKIIEGKAKHRYFFPLGSKTQKRKMRNWLSLNYTIQNYPKGESQKYKMEDKREERKNLLNIKTLFD